MNPINFTQKAIIRLLLVNDALSHKTLAKDLNLSNPGLTLSVRPLLQEGILINAGSFKSGKVGRQEEMLKLNPEYGYLGGIDVRKHYFYVSLTDLKGNIREFTRVKDLSEFNMLLTKYEAKYPKILGFDVALRGYQSEKEISVKHKGLNDFLTKKGYKHRFINNVESLANIHFLLYPEDRNFLLIKYGPGVGSSLFIDGKPVKNKEGNAGDFGNTYTKDGHRIEDLLSFESLLGDEFDEREGAEMIMKDSDKIDFIISHLAFGLFNSASLLGLDKIIFSGVLLTNPMVMDKLSKAVMDLADGHPLSKVQAYENYNQITDEKGSLQLFSDLFGE